MLKRACKFCSTSDVITPLRTGGEQVRDFSWIAWVEDGSRAWWRHAEKHWYWNNLVLIFREVLWWCGEPEVRRTTRCRHFQCVEEASHPGARNLHRKQLSYRTSRKHNEPNLSEGEPARMLIASSYNRIAMTASCDVTSCRKLSLACARASFILQSSGPSSLIAPNSRSREEAA